MRTSPFPRIAPSPSRGDIPGAREPAVSEVIGSLILVGVVVISMAIVGTLLFSQAPPAKVPHFHALVTNQTTDIYIQHKGGDALSAGEFRILVDGMDLSSSFTNNGDDPWSVGETLYGTAPSMPASVVIVLNQSAGGSLVLLSETLEGARTIPPASSVEWYNFGPTGRCDWAFRKSITIPASHVTGSHADFPVLIHLSSDEDLAAAAKSDGTSIVFTAADGTTKISHEIESFTKATGALDAWVKVPSLSSSGDTVLWMYYGNTGAVDQQDTANVWSAGYNAVWHHDHDFLDSTSNNNDGTNSGSTNTDGKIARAQSYDGASSYVNTGSDGSIDQIWATGGTFSTWIRPSSLGENSEGRITDKTSAATAAYGWYLATYTGNELRFRRGYATTVGAWTTPADSLVMDGWNHVVVTYTDGTANNPAIYINGVPVTVTRNTAPSGTQRSDASYTWRIGNRAGGTDYSFDGLIDEIRASKTLRSADWIATEYANQNDPTGFMSPGDQEVWWKC